MERPGTDDQLGNYNTNLDGLCMPRMKIINGFVNINGRGNILAGDLLEGEIKIGDKLIIKNETKIPIIEVLVEEISFIKKILITIPREYDNAAVWYKLYGKEFEIETAKNNAD